MPELIPANFATPDEISARREYAKFLMDQTTKPITHWAEGSANIIRSLLGGYESGVADRDARAAQAGAYGNLFDSYKGLQPGSTPNTPAPMTSGAPAPSPGGPDYGGAISSIESGGKYDALGPVIPTTGDRAYGKYQVMGANIPAWTKEHLGREMTPEQFAASPEAQEAVFKGQFGKYVQQTGNPNDAASMWFTGKPLAEGAARKDILGTSGQDYVNRFAQALQAPQGGAPAPQAGMLPASPAAPIAPAGPPAATPNVMAQVLQSGPGQAPRVPTVAPSMPPASGGAPPNLDGVLRAAANPWLGKTGQHVTEAVLKQQLVPKDQFVTQTGPDGQPFQVNLTTGKRDTDPTAPPEAIRTVREMMNNPAKYGFKGPDDPELIATARQKLSGMQSSVAVNTVANPVLEGVGKQIVAARDKAQTAAYNVIPQIHDARKTLDEGIVAGAFADQRLSMQKIGALFGMSPEAASNTETFKSVIGNEVLAHIKALGANPSNADRVFIEKVQAGDINLEPTSIRKILDIGEKYARQAITNFNRDSDKLVTASPEAYRGIAPLMKFDMPGEYTAPQKPPPAAPAVVPAPAGADGWQTIAPNIRIREKQ